ncbi:MAG TPA: hypothetical protein VFZ61_26860, partial [Polyangiales bacterium]
TQTAESTALDAGPASLALVPKGADLGPLTVIARGLRRGESVVERAAEVSFVAQQTLVVELHLLASCVGVVCADNESCTERGCQPRQLDQDDLTPWSGEAPSVTPADVDAGADAGLDADASHEDATSEDADTLADASTLAEGGEDAGNWESCGADAGRVNLDTDINHCGMCRNVCRTTARNSLPICEMGDCGSKCRPNFDDCDENPTNGCEQNLFLQDNCGMCGRSCEMGTVCRFGNCL